MQPLGEEVSASENGGDPRWRSVAQLEYDSIDLPYVQTSPVHQLLIQDLAPDVHLIRP
jgi:hypothetical protein